MHISVIGDYVPNFDTKKIFREIFARSVATLIILFSVLGKNHNKTAQKKASPAIVPLHENTVSR
jgi:hypothetical protein